MVDAQTQYSSPEVNEQEKEQNTQSLSATHTAQTSTPTPASQISRLHINEATGNTSQPQSQPAQSSTNTSRTASSESTSAAPTSTTRTKPYDPVADAAMSVAPTGTNTIAATSAPPPSSTKEPGTDKSEKESVPHTPSHSTKRNHSTSADARPETLLHNASATSANLESSSKKPRPESQPSKLMPPLYWHASTKDLVLLISSMLMELIRYNDSLTLSTSNLTRFHSRAPPGISVHDYLSRLTTHATLSPPILLSMVYYIDKLCALYPAFTISSLTVHRFLITAATVASKGLSDSFWTNKTYARVGGVSVKELALLELEFLIRIQWRIVPVPEVLGRYYRRLVERTIGYELEGGEEGMSEGEEGDGMAATRVDGHVEPQWMREQEQGRGRDERQ
ncbi:Pho80p cyclin [Knufia obscura]|uniref:Pho80p cyclin n=1 Tax=Knufia obscura TaxID=1635080 RepID=A0ABR0R8L5_9EURO|nr:Pho80p cyclin [Knufia obscura]